MHGHHDASDGEEREPSPPPSRAGSVVLDIGEDTGALVAYAPSSLNGREIEIRERGRSWQGVHTAVRARVVAGGVRYAGVFGALTAGPYELRVRGDDGAAPLAVRVRPGSVTEAVLGT